MPIEAQRAFRLALGCGLATAVTYGAALPMPFLAVMLTAVLLAPPAPPPALRAVITLFVLIAVACGAGLLISSLLVHQAAAGVLIVVLGVAGATYLGFRPGMAIAGVMLTIGLTLIAAIGAYSSAAGVALVQTMLVGVALAVVVAHLAGAAFPEAAGSAPPMAPPGGAIDHRWVAIRTALIMLPPFILTLSDPARYMLLIMKGSQLAQQAEVGATRRLAVETILSTILGGAGAWVLWRALQLKPDLLMFTLSMTLAVLLIARPLYGAVKTRFSFLFWQNTLVTLIILVGPAVQDTASGDDVDRKMMIRIAAFLALSLYAVLAVFLLDTLRHWLARGRLVGRIP